MDILKDLQALAIASRMKRLSDKIFYTGDIVYKNNNITFQASWFPFFFLLKDGDAFSVSEIAEHLGQTHSGISQLSKKLEKEGLVRNISVESDDRKRYIKLTEYGLDLVQKIKPLWVDILKTMSDYIEKSGTDLINAIDSFESVFNPDAFIRDVGKRVRARNESSVEIIPYSPEYRDSFKELNYEWLEKFFYIEEIDSKVLSDPEKYILSTGGYIYFAMYNQEIIGTCALIKETEGIYELSKMAVTEKYQGLKAGKKLAEAIIDKFKELNGKTLFLESNSKLEPAIKLYEKAGFKHKGRKNDSHYQRSNVYMIWEE